MHFIATCHLSPLWEAQGTRSRLRLDFLSLLQINQQLDLLKVSIVFFGWLLPVVGGNGEMAVRGESRDGQEHGMLNGKNLAVDTHVL